MAYIGCPIIPHVHLHGAPSPLGQLPGIQDIVLT